MDDWDQFVRTSFTPIKWCHFGIQATVLLCSKVSEVEMRCHGRINIYTSEVVSPFNIERRYCTTDSTSVSVET